MEMSKRLSWGLSALLMGSIMLTGGCATSGQTGALAGGGIGALAGQAIGGSTEATLIGAAVGTGVGYIIGNEKDKKKAREMSQSSRSTDYSHSEVSPLARTRWNVVSLAPRGYAPAFVSKIVDFDSSGHVTTTTTLFSGAVEVAKERYRVVGKTLIVNKPGYIINAEYRIKGDEMVVDAEDFRAVLRRIP
jgi:hypothetical protein